MLPSSTNNDSPDYQRRRRRRSSSDDGPSNLPVPAILLALDSPAERVAARKRRLLRGRGDQGVGHRDISSPSTKVEGSFKMKLAPTNSSRSLDSAADMLKRERMERLQTQNRQSQSHHQRQSLPFLSNDRSQRGTRSSLPDFKSIIRNMILSKKPSQEQEQQRIRSASEHHSRPSYTPVIDSQRSTREVKSEHKRSIKLRQHRRGSDTSLFLGAAERHINEEEAIRRRSSPDDARAAAADTITSPCLITSLRRKSACAIQRLGSKHNQSRPFTSAALDQEHHDTLEDHSDTLTTQDSIDDSSNSEGASSRLPLASALSSRLKRKTKRAELVQELSLKDSLRVRDRSSLSSEAQLSPDNDDIIQQRDREHSPPQQALEFSTEEECQVSDLVTPVASSHKRGGASDKEGDQKAKLKSPFDDTASIRPEEEPTPTRSSTTGTVAAILSSTNLASSSSLLVEVENTGHKPLMRQGHSSWPAASSPSRRRKSRSRSSSLSPKREKEVATRKSKAKRDQGAVSDRHSSAKIAHSSSRARTDRKDKLSSSSSSQRASSSKTKSHIKGGSVSPPGQPPPRHRRSSSLELVSSSHHPHEESRSDGSNRQSEKATKPREKPRPRRSSSLELVSSSQHPHGGRRSVGSDRHIRKATKSHDKPASGNKAKKKQESSSSLTDSSTSELHSSSRSNLDNSTRKSQTKKKPKVKRDEKTDFSSSKSPRRIDPSSSSLTYVDNSVDPNDSRTPKKSPRLPKKKKKSPEDASERSITVDDIARLDESGTSLVDDSKRQEDTTEAKAKRKKKTKKASSTGRLHSSTRSTKSAKAKKAWRSEPTGMKLSSSFDEDDSRKKEKAAEKKSVRRSRTQEKLTMKPSLASSAKTRSARSPGKSPHKSPRARNRKKVAKDEACDTKADGGNSQGDLKIRSSQTSATEGATQDEQKRSPRQGEKHNSDTTTNAIAAEGNESNEALVDNCNNNETSVASQNKPEITRKEHNRTSIATYLSKDEATEKQQKAEKAAHAESPNHDNLSRMPPLTDFLSVDLSTDSSKSGSSQPVDEMSKSTEESRAKEGHLSSLDAIAENPNELVGPRQRESFDVMRLQAADIFHDSPNVSPLATNLPLLWGSQTEDSAIERLASSMPNLDYHHYVRDDSKKPGTKPADDEGIFQDDSDNSPISQDLPDLEPICDDNHVNVMSEIAEQIEDRHDTKALQPRPASGDESFRASLLSEFKISSPKRTSPAPASATASPRQAKATTPGKHDRGPRKPQRRRDSFEDEKSPEPSEEGLPSDVQQMESSLEWDDETDTQKESSPSLAYSSANMEFHKTDDKGWVQTPPERRRDLASESVSSSAQDLPSSARNTGAPRRRNSMSDLEDARAFAVSERWSSASNAQKTDTPPSSSRQSYPSANGRAFVGMERHYFSLPKGEGSKELARTYLPVSLQSAARCYERAGKQAPGTATARSREDTVRRSRSEHNSRSIAVDTGFSDMFQVIGELEEDLVKFENQVTFLRAQRARLLDSEESGMPEGETEEAGKEPPDGKMES